MAKIVGVKQVKRAIRRAGDELTEEALVEVRKSTKAMFDDARAGFDTAGDIAPLYHGQRGMQSVSGVARRFYRWSVSKARLSGRVGLLSERANRMAFYLRFFNDGTVNQPARPVHDNAFENERETFIGNQTEALDRVLRKVFK